MSSIWKRLLPVLPYLVAKQGTSEATHLLRNPLLWSKHRPRRLPHIAMRKSGESAVSFAPSDWEVQLDRLLQQNNERLIERLQQSFGRTSIADKLLTNVTTDSAMDPYNRISTGTLLGPIATTGPRDTTHSAHSVGVVSEYVESVNPPEPGESRRMSRASGTSKGRRQSMSSMTSEEETQHVQKLKTTQMENKDRESYSRRSTTSLVSRETFLTYIRKIVSSWAFEAFYAFAILSNSVSIGVEVHYAAHSRGKPMPAAFFVIDQSYAALFFLELLLRVLAEGKPFFWSSPNVAWNYLDILINITSVLNLASFLSGVGQDTSTSTFDASGNVRIIRILRLTRVIRVVRIVKIVRFIRALRSLVYSIFGTMKVLLWSVLLLFMIMRLHLFAHLGSTSSLEFRALGRDIDGTVHAAKVLAGGESVKLADFGCSVRLKKEEDHTRLQIADL
eukprot:s1333_g1.t1